MGILNSIIFIGFFPAVILICLGIWHEEKLIAWESRQWNKIKNLFKKS